jgi:hypothetical protein
MITDYECLLHTPASLRGPNILQIVFVWVPTPCSLLCGHQCYSLSMGAVIHASVKRHKIILRLKFRTFSRLINLFRTLNRCQQQFYLINGQKPWDLKFYDLVKSDLVGFTTWFESVIRYLKSGFKPIHELNIYVHFIVIVGEVMNHSYVVLKVSSVRGVNNYI